MFGFFKKSSQQEAQKSTKTAKITVQVDGMHCTSSSSRIDSGLEALVGAGTATTSYAQQKTTIEYDPEKVGAKEFAATITKLGYKIK